MDQDIEKIYSLLMDLQCPVTLSELKNPTSECMVKVVLTFLSGFSIDGETIQKGTFGQDQCLSYRESHEELISLINLHAAILQISNRIFMKDFYLTDMSSPGAKKARRLIWTLLNFVLYANNKMEELVKPSDNIFNRWNMRNDLIEKKNEVMKNRKDVVLQNSKKTALKEKYIKQIEELKIDDEQKDQKVIAQLKERVRIAKLAKHEVEQKHGSIKQQVIEMNEKITGMEDAVVKSPEEYETQLVNFGKAYADKQQVLQAMINKLHGKQNTKSQFEKVQTFVDQEYEKYSEVKESVVKYGTLAEMKKEIEKGLEDVVFAVQSLHAEIEKLNENNQCNKEKVDRVTWQCQEHIAPLLKSQTKLQSQVQDMRRKFEEALLSCQQSRREKDELQREITILDKEIAEFLKRCQEMYINDITEQLSIQKLFKNRNCANQ